MLRYVPRLVPAGTAPRDALVEPLIENPPASPLGEHELVQDVAWMVERDGAFVHVPAAARAELEMMRGSAILTMLDGGLVHEALDHLPGRTFAATGTYAAELLLDRDHLDAMHAILEAKVFLAAAPHRGRLLLGGVRGGMEGMSKFVEHVRREHDAAPVADRISPVTLLVRAGAARAVVGEMQLTALEHAAGDH